PRPRQRSARRGHGRASRGGTRRGLFRYSWLVCTSPAIKILQMDNVNLTDNFLIAMPTLEDPYFSSALVYICEHNENGALGIIVNRPIDMNMAGLFEKIDIKLEHDKLADLPVYFGGPVQLDRGFVLHRPLGDWQSTLAVNGEVGLTSS